MLTFKADELKTIITKCARFSIIKGLNPIHEYIELKGNQISVNSGIMGIKYQSPITFEEEFILPAQMIAELLSSLTTNKDVTLTEMEGKERILFEAGKFKTEIPLPRYEFLSFEVPPEDRMKPIPAGFCESIRQVMFCVPRDEKAKEGLRGVNYDGDSFYASDNIRLSRFTPAFKLDDTLFIPSQIIEHLFEDEPLGYCIEEREGRGSVLWFKFERYIIFGSFSNKPFPLGKKYFDAVLSEREHNSVSIIPCDLASLKKATNRIAILAKQNMNRLNLIAESKKNELILYVQTRDGTEAIEFIPVNLKSDLDRPVFIALDASFFKEAIEKTTEFFFTDEFIYFTNPEFGLESAVQPLGVDDAAKILERVGKHSCSRENQETEMADSTGERGILQDLEG